MSTYQERQFPISVAFVFAGAACLFVTVAVAASNFLLPDTSGPSVAFPQTELALSQSSPDTTTPKVPLHEPQNSVQPVAPAVDYVNLVEPAQVLAVSEGLIAPSISSSTPELSVSFAPIVRSTGWQSARPTGSPKVLASLGDLEVSPPAIRDVPAPLSDHMASVFTELVPELRFEDTVNRLLWVAADEPMIASSETDHRLASHGPTTAELLFPTVLIDPLPEQIITEAPAASVPEVQVEKATIEPVLEPTAPEAIAVDKPAYALKPQPRPERPVITETPKEAAPKPAASQAASISEVSVAGSKRVSVVGVFQTRSAAWALLALENGQIVKVTNGTKLSSLRVSRIRGDKVWIRVGNAERSLRAGDVIKVN